MTIQTSELNQLMSLAVCYKICGMERPFVITVQVPNMHSNATIACGNKQSDIPPDKGSQRIAATATSQVSTGEKRAIANAS